MSEKIGNYDTDKFHAVLVWLMHEAVPNPIQTMHTTCIHADKVRKRIAKEQVKPIAEYNDFIGKLVNYLKDNDGEIACEKCLFGFEQYQTAVYMDALIKTDVVRIIGKKIKWLKIGDSNEEKALVDEEVGQWWNLNDEEEDGEANESSDSEADNFENNNAPARAKTGRGTNTGKKNPGKHTVYTSVLHKYSVFRIE